MLTFHKRLSVCAAAAPSPTLPRKRGREKKTPGDYVA
jgi:hypothetical protein